MSEPIGAMAAGPQAGGADIDRVAHAIAAEGYAICAGFLSPSEASELRERAFGRHRDGAFQRAGIGRANARRIDDDERGDEILWLDPGTVHPAERACLDRMEALRHAVNRACLLGLFQLECHFARYAAGAGYRKHVDRFRDDDARRLSVVLYLNEDWTDADGGCLRLDLPAGSAIDVMPRAGTLVAFLSADFPHEVLPARRSRWSLAGWFRSREGAVPWHRG